MTTLMNPHKPITQIHGLSRHCCWEKLDLKVNPWIYRAHQSTSSAACWTSKALAKPYTQGWENISLQPSVAPVLSTLEGCMGVGVGEWVPVMCHRIQE